MLAHVVKQLTSEPNTSRNEYESSEHSGAPQQLSGGCLHEALQVPSPSATSRGFRTELPGALGSDRAVSTRNDLRVKAALSSAEQRKTWAGSGHDPDEVEAT